MQNVDLTYEFWIWAQSWPQRYAENDDTPVEQLRVPYFQTHIRNLMKDHGTSKVDATSQPFHRTRERDSPGHILQALLDCLLQELMPSNCIGKLGCLPGPVGPFSVHEWLMRIAKFGQPGLKAFETTTGACNPMFP